MTTSTKHRGFRSILCPVDFSKCSGVALEYARAVAGRNNAVLHVIYVNDPLLVLAAATSLHDRELVKRSLRELEAFTNKTLGATKPGRVSLQVLVGDPVKQILKAARSRGADLIVMGTHGLTGADRWLVGSTTLDVLKRTSVPVLAIPGRGRRSRVPESWPGERILAAIDLGGKPVDDVAVAIRAASAFGSALLLGHVVKRRAAPAWLRPLLNVESRELERVRRQMTNLATVARRQTVADIRIKRGAIGEALSALARAERLQLVVITLRERHRWFEPKRGALTYQLLSRARIPVLACPPGWSR